MLQTIAFHYLSGCPTRSAKQATALSLPWRGWDGSSAGAGSVWGCRGLVSDGSDAFWRHRGSRAHPARMH